MKIKLFVFVFVCDKFLYISVPLRWPNITHIYFLALNVQIYVDEKTRGRAKNTYIQIFTNAGIQRYWREINMNKTKKKQLSLQFVKHIDRIYLMYELYTSFAVESHNNTRIETPRQLFLFTGRNNKMLHQLFLYVQNTLKC